MRAMVLPQFGGPELFEARDIETPTAGVGEILVRIHATGTNPVEAKLRADGSWAGLSPPVVLGYDAAGVVEAVGAGVDAFVPGDEVFYTPEIFGNTRGTYAQFNAVAAALVAPKPRGLSFEQAAAVPLAGGTAWEAVIRRLRVRAGETVLVQAGAGGVGSYAVQFAKAAGARVLATAGTEHQQTLRDLGVDVPIDYQREDVTTAVLDRTAGAGVDAAFDIQGPALVSRTLPLVRPGGRVACILSPAGDLSPLYQKNITLHGVFLTREGQRLREMTPLFERGQVEPLIDQVLPLESVAQAHQRLDTGHGRGKIVLQVGD